jgi:hypothetical protein
MNLNGQISNLTYGMTPVSHGTHLLQQTEPVITPQNTPINYPGFNEGK